MWSSSVTLWVILLLYLIIVFRFKPYSRCGLNWKIFVLFNLNPPILPDLDALNNIGKTTEKNQ